MGSETGKRKMLWAVFLAALIVVCVQASGMCDNAAAAGAGQPGFNSPNDPVWNTIDAINEAIGKFFLWLMK